jgi:quinohemoprotein ethanol dehydrogenase
VRYVDKEVVLWPSFEAVHHWLPQSWSPLTGLMYEPTVEMPSPFGDVGVHKDPWNPRLYTPEFSGLTLGSADVPPDAGNSVLKAWDPKTQKAVWEVKTRGISNGGTLATAGNLVFQGLADGYLHAYSATSGKDDWSYFAGVAVTGMPITYRVDGRQYLSITAGPLNGSVGAFGSISSQWGWDSRIHPRRLLTFALDGTAKLPPTPPPHTTVVADREPASDPEKTARGAYEYARCQLCHGPAAVAGGIAPDLRASPVPKSAAAFASIVRGGALVTHGMPAFPELDDAQLDALRHYLRTVGSPTGQ